MWSRLPSAWSAEASEAVLGLEQLTQPVLAFLQLAKSQRNCRTVFRQRSSEVQQSVMLRALLRITLLMGVTAVIYEAGKQ